MAGLAITRHILHSQSFSQLGHNLSKLLLILVEIKYEHNSTIFYSYHRSGFASQSKCSTGTRSSLASRKKNLKEESYIQYYLWMEPAVPFEIEILANESHFTSLIYLKKK